MKKSKILDFFKKHYRILVIFLFVSLALFVGVKHEPWLDEAQAWLIARDASLYSLFFKYLHAEGHPALWYLILKFVQLLGLNYKYIYIVPIVFSTIGVIILLYKSDFPWYIKCLLPFTFFIFYQYTIVARSYCLIFPLLSLLAVIWKDRYNKIWIFTFIIVLLINCETHIYLFAGSIYFYLLLETFIEWKKNRIKREKKVYICFVILFISFLLTLLYVFPTSTTHIPSQIRSYVISDSFITIYDANDIIKFVVSMLMIMFLVLFVYKNDMKALFRLVLFVLPVMIFMNVIHIRNWHFGIITLMFISIIWMEGYENNRYIKLFLLLMCIIQIPWSFKSSLYDYKNTYTSALDVVDFLKEYDYENLKIVGSNFYAAGLNPYFEKNIFINWQQEIGFLYLDFTNECFQENYDVDYVLKNDIDIYIDYVGNTDDIDNIDKEEYDKLDNYNKYLFEGYIPFEGKRYKNQSSWVFVRKDIDDNKVKESN